MAPKHIDSLGRITRFYDDMDPSIKISPSAVPILSRIKEYPFINSSYIQAFSGKHPKLVASYLTKLRKRGYVVLPEFTRRTIYNVNNQLYCYRITKLGENWLIDHGIDIEPLTVPRDGFHDYGVTATVASIELGALRHEHAYVPGRQLLARAHADLRVDLSGKQMQPDHLFGIDYGTKRALFAVEFDRGTEQVSDTGKARKSYQRMIDEYVEYIGQEVYMDHLKLQKTRMYALFVFSRRSAELSFQKMVKKRLGACSYILTRTTPGIDPDFNPQRPDYELYEGPWWRSDKPEFYINRP